MKTLAFALPWLLVAVAAVVFAFAAPVEGTWWEKIRHYLVPMLVAAVLMRFGVGISEGIEEGLKQRQRPGRPDGAG